MNNTGTKERFSQDQASILKFIIEHVAARDEIETLSFRLDGDGEPFFVAALDLGRNEQGKEVRLLVTLPTHSQGVFLALTVAQTKEVARLLANLEDYERDTGHVLHPLETVVIDGHAEIKALFLLRTASHSKLTEIPDAVEINSHQRNFSLVLGIDAQEYACKTDFGVDALLDLLEESDKSLIFFE